MMLEILLLILGLPAGFFIAWLARDELVQGRKWFLAVIFISAIIGTVSFFLGNFYISWTLGFVSLVSAISIWKSYDIKWTKKKI